MALYESVLMDALIGWSDWWIDRSVDWSVKTDLYCTDWSVDWFDDWYIDSSVPCFLSLKYVDLYDKLYVILKHKTLIKNNFNL